MKKLVSMFAAIVAAFSFNSCDNESIFDQPDQSSDITVNISVASLEPDTKAIKTNWANGDKINIWFNSTLITTTPQLVLTYDGAKWSASSMTEATISALKASGYNLKAVYESTNSIFAGSSRDLTSSKFGEETVYYTPMSCRCQVPYTFSSNTLTAEINSWTFDTNCQVVIAGLDPVEASNYALQIKDVATNTIGCSGTGYGDTKWGWGLGYNPNPNYSGGMSNEDGVAFRFANMAVQFNGKTGDLLFTLIHKNGSTIDKTWTFTKNNTKADWDTDRCYGIKINKYKFMNTTDANLLQGLFSVSATKTVQFTKGNLQATYDGTGYTWALAAHQYDFIGNAAGNTTIDAQTNGAVVDLFGFSTDAANNNWGIHTKEVATDGFTTGNFNDWGNLSAFSGKNYFTLSEAEWKYLLNYGNAASGARTQTNRYAMAMVNGVKGLLIFPDNYNGTTAVSGTGIGSVNATTNLPDSSIPNDTWTTMESAGVVFLPITYFRSGSAVDTNWETGYYWTSNSKYLKFQGPNSSRPNGSIGITTDSFCGHSVRLVSAN